MIRFASRVGAALALAATVLPVCAQEFPTKPITVIVPFAAGGPTDTVARLIAQSMTGTLKQQVLVENAGGAGGTIGATKAARAPADWLHVVSPSYRPIHGARRCYRKLPYDAIKDFRADRPHHRRAHDDRFEEGLRAEGHERSSSRM
jgi:tripartite-type tricarboxylate transporter receptor subunit TctC